MNPGVGLLTGRGVGSVERQAYWEEKLKRQEMLLEKLKVLVGGGGDV